MATSTIKQSPSIITAMVRQTVSLAANEIKYFEAMKPSDTSYTWILYTICTLTTMIAVNDYANNGFRLKNNTASALNDRTIELYWLGFRV
jgi:hypothetical protein